MTLTGGDGPRNPEDAGAGGLGRFWRTLRVLRRAQVLWRGRNRVRKVLGLHRRAPVPLRAALDPVCLDRVRDHLRLCQSMRPTPEEMLERLVQGRFRFLAREEPFEDPSIWNNTNLPRLWRYHLHYFDYLRELAAAHCDQQPEQAATTAGRWLKSWVAANPPGTDVAWDPYVIARRLLNWPCGFAVFGAEEALSRSYAQQALYLSRNLEYDIEANHLLTDAMAITMAGAVLGNHSLGAGLTLLERLLGEQILSDGAHYELSPMYHAQILEDLLLLYAALAEKPPFLRVTIERMTHYLRAICHTDGDIPLFGDAAFDVTLPPQALLRLAEKVCGMRAALQPRGSYALSRSGFYILAARDNRARMILKAGPPLPSYQLGHAHCDALSFEFTLGQRRIIVDSGVHGYAESALRAYCRSTRAHNTVCVNGEEQLECWHVFRVGARYTWLKSEWKEREHAIEFRGAYRLPSGRTHERRVRFDQKSWFIEDTIEGNGEMQAESYLHFHPKAELTISGAGYVATLGGSSLGIVPLAGAPEFLPGAPSAESWYCPRFGEAQAAPLLVMRAAGAQRLSFGYALLPQPSTPLVAVTPPPLLE